MPPQLPVHRTHVQGSGHEAHHLVTLPRQQQTAISSAAPTPVGRQGVAGAAVAPKISRSQPLGIRVIRSRATPRRAMPVIELDGVMAGGPTEVSVRLLTHRDCLKRESLIGLDHLAMDIQRATDPGAKPFTGGIEGTLVGTADDRPFRRFVDGFLCIPTLGQRNQLRPIEGHRSAIRCQRLDNHR